jgi:hypothetical protein
MCALPDRSSQFSRTRSEVSAPARDMNGTTSTGMTSLPVWRGSCSAARATWRGRLEFFTSNSHRLPCPSLAMRSAEASALCDGSMRRLDPHVRIIEQVRQAMVCLAFRHPARPLHERLARR